MADKNSVTGELGRIVDAIQGSASVSAPGGISSGSLFELMAAAGPYEEVLVRHSVGTGTVKYKDKEAYIIVTGTMYDLNGREDGTYEAVFKAGFSKPEDLLDYPSKPNNVYDRPTTVQQVKYLARTKARWTFADGSSCEGPGPAPSYICPLTNGNVQFWVSAGAVVVAGTGRYEGCFGQQCSLGSTWFAAQPTLEEGEQFEARVLHIFKLIKKKDRA